MGRVDTVNSDIQGEFTTRVRNHAELARLMEFPPVHTVQIAKIGPDINNCASKIRDDEEANL